MIVIQSVQGRHARRTTVVSVSPYFRWYASRFRRFSSTRSLGSSGSPAGGAHRPPPPDGRTRPLPFGDPLVPQLPLPGRDPCQFAAVEPRAAASRATIDRDSGLAPLDQESRTARALHCRLRGRSRTGWTAGPEAQLGSCRGTPGLARNRHLSRIVASTGSTCSAVGGRGRSARRRVPSGRSARTPFPVRARGGSRRFSQAPPGPAISRGIGHRGPRRHRRGSVRGVARRIADSPRSTRLSGGVRQTKKTPRGDSPRRVSIRGSHPSRKGRVTVRTTVLTTSPDRGAIYSPFIEGGVYGSGDAGVKRIRASCAECEATKSPVRGDRADRTALRHGPAMERPLPAAHPAWLLSRCQRIT